MKESKAYSVEECIEKLSKSSLRYESGLVATVLPILKEAKAKADKKPFWKGTTVEKTKGKPRRSYTCSECGTRSPFLRKFCAECGASFVDDSGIIRVEK